MTNPGQAIGPSGITPGADVYGSDDKKVGTVQQAFEDSFLVRKGMLFVHDYYIPYAYVARVSPDRIDLNMTSDEARDQDLTPATRHGRGRLRRCRGRHLSLVSTGQRVPRTPYKAPPRATTPSSPIRVARHPLAIPAARLPCPWRA